MKCPWCSEQIDYVVAEVGVPVDSEGVIDIDSMGAVAEVENVYSCPACKKKLEMDMDIELPYE